MISKNRKRTLLGITYRKLLYSGTVGWVVYVIQIFANMIISGRYFGETALAAAELIAPLITATVFISGILPTGTCILSAHRAGKGDSKGQAEIAGRSLLMTMIAGAVLLLMFTVFIDTYLSLFDVSEAVADCARDYFRWYKFALCLNPVFDLINNLVMYDGDEKAFTAASLSVVICTTVGSAFLAGRIGVTGVGLGVFIGYILGNAFHVSHFFKKSCSTHFILNMKKDEMGELFKLGISHALEHFYESVVLFVFNTVIIRTSGEAGLPIASAAMMLLNIRLLLCGIPSATMPLTSVYFGERNNHGIKRVMNKAHFAALCEGLAYTVLAFVLAKLIPWLLHIQTPEILKAAELTVGMICITSVFSALVKLYSAYYETLCRTALGVSLGALDGAVMPVIIALVFGSLAGINAIWLSLMLSPVASIAAFCAAAAVFGYGKRLPYFLNDCGVEARIFDYALESNSVSALCADISELMKSEGISSAKINKVSLALEETSMLIAESNPGRTVLGELSIWTGEKTRAILRYNGNVINTASEDTPKSLRRYVADCVTSSLDETNYTLITGCNRLSIEV